MERFEFENGILEYEDSTHSYYFNGKKCLSVTQLLKKRFPRKYENIDPDVLKRASEKGTWVHECIEIFETFGLRTDELQEFRDYCFLKSYYGFKVLKNEIPIVIQVGDVVIAGRLDMIIKDKNDGICVCDIKSTSILDLEYLSWQTSLYKLGFEQTYPKEKKVKNLKALHLKNGTRKYVSISEVEQEKLIEFIKENNNENK